MVTRAVILGDAGSNPARTTKFEGQNPKQRRKDMPLVPYKQRLRIKLSGSYCYICRKAIPKGKVKKVGDKCICDHHKVAKDGDE